MGDSNAAMLIPAFTAMAETNDLTLSVAVADGCPWQRGFVVMDELWSPHCGENQEDAYRRLVPSLDPDVIVLMDAELPESRLASTARMRSTSTASLEQLRATGRTILLVDPIVRSPADEPPLECLDEATFLEDCRYVADLTPSRTDRLHEELADGKPDVRTVDLDTLACPYLPICDPMVDGKVVRWDLQHLSLQYASTLGDELTATFEQLGLLRPGGTR